MKLGDRVKILTNGLRDKEGVIENIESWDHIGVKVEGLHCIYTFTSMEIEKL